MCEQVPRYLSAALPDTLLGASEHYFISQASVSQASLPPLHRWESKWESLKIHRWSRESDSEWCSFSAPCGLFKELGEGRWGRALSQNISIQRTQSTYCAPDTLQGTGHTRRKKWPP